MTKYLAKIVENVANNIYEDDIEEYDKDLYNLLDLPQNPSYLEDVIKFAKNGLNVIDRRKSKSYLKISANENSWIRFNLYDCDEPNYGYKGDVNSLDFTKDVYNLLINN